MVQSTKKILKESVISKNIHVKYFFKIEGEVDVYLCIDMHRIYLEQ